VLLWIDHRWVEEVDGGVGAEEKWDGGEGRGAALAEKWKNLRRLAVAPSLSVLWELWVDHSAKGMGRLVGSASRTCRYLEAANRMDDTGNPCGQPWPARSPKERKPKKSREGAKRKGSGRKGVGSDGRRLGSGAVELGGLVTAGIRAD
jgi:hypothetical protein